MSNKELKQKRREEWIESQGGACKFCGATEQLEVDHIASGTKAIHTSNIWESSVKLRQSELAKCQVLCEKCHAFKTNQENFDRRVKNPRVSKHGTVNEYINHRCRCSECRTAWAKWSYEKGYTRRYRLKKKMSI